MTKPQPDPQFPFTDIDIAMCDAIIREHHLNTEDALPVWLAKDEKLHPERYADPDLNGPAGLAAWDFFVKRCKALGLEFSFGSEEESGS